MYILRVRELKINEKIYREGILKEAYFIKEIKYINNILHYVIKSSISREIILSKSAIEKDFILQEHFSMGSGKRNFADFFRNKIKKIIFNK